MNHDVFISYSTQDKEAAFAVCHILEQNGVRCWIAPRDVSPGDKWGDAIEAAIKGCFVVVVLFSEFAAVSQWVNGELNVAFDEQKHIIPFRLDKTPLTGQSRVMLGQRHWIEAYPDYKTKFSDLVSAVCPLLGGDSSGVNKDAVEANAKPEIGEPKRYRMIFFFMSVFVPLCAIVSAVFWGARHYGSNMVTKAKEDQKDEVRAEGSLKGDDVEGNELDNTAVNASDEISQQRIIKDILRGMVQVDGGVFLMGAKEYEDGTVETDAQKDIETPQIRKEVKSFLIGKNEVTVDQWRAFMGGRCLDGVPNMPIRNVNFEECLEFTKRLSDVSGVEFSLPSEAEWEFAARGGGCSDGTKYSGGNNPNVVAWYRETSGGVPHVCNGHVSKMDCNELDIFDMSGNVGEWCLEDFVHYSDFVLSNSTPYTVDSHSKVVRGGGFDSFANQISVFHREPMNKKQRANNVGMRLVVRNVDKHAERLANLCVGEAVECDMAMNNDMRRVYEACIEIRTAIGSGSTIGLQSAARNLKDSNVEYFADFCLIEGAQIPLAGHLVFNEEFIFDLIERKEVYAFAQKYGHKRGNPNGRVYLKTCVIDKLSSARYGFRSSGHQELAFVTEPGGLVSIKIHDKTNDKWYRDVESFRNGRKSRFFSFDLPSGNCNLEVEIFNRASKGISFAVISN